MALLNWLTDRVYDTFYQDDKKRLAQSNAAYQQQVQAHQNRNVLSPQQYTQQLRGAAQNANNAVRYNAPAPRPQQPTPQIKKPTVNQATLTGRNLKTAAGMALTPGGAPLAPAALLGAFDKEGPFSAYHQQQFKNFTNPVTSKLQEYNDWVNKDDPTEGFQINSLGDWGRLGRTLLPSMALGLMEAPVKSAEAASGSGIRDDKKTDLTPLQRVGSGADAAITVGGLPYGGSGTFMKSLLPKTAKTLAPAGGNLLKTLASGTWNIAKDAGKEGVEEVVQTFASDLSDDSRVNTPLTQYRDAGVTGAAGGTLFSGAGKTIEFTKSVPSRVDTSIHNNLSKNDPNYQSLLFEREYTTNNLEKTAIDQKLQQARQQVITQAPGKVVNKAKTDIESLQQIPHERTIQHPEVQAIAEQGNVLRQHRTDLMNRGLSYNSPAVKAVENAMRELGKDYNATYKRVYEQTKQEMLEPLIKANEFTRNHLIPGGTLGGPLAGDFSKAQEQDLIIKNGEGKAMSVEPKLSDTDLAYINETVAQYSDPQKYINDQVEAIWARNKQGQGVDTALITKENSYDVEKRVTMSNNTPFYQDFYKEYGHKPTKREIADMLKAELEGETTLLSKTQEVTPFEREIYQQIKDNSVAPEVDTTDYSIAFEANRANQSASQPTAQSASTKPTVQPTSVETKAKTPTPQETKSTRTKQSSQTSKTDVQTTQRGQTRGSDTSSLKNQKATVETSYLDDTPENRAKQAPHEIGDALDKHLGHKDIKSSDYKPTQRLNDNFIRKGADKLGLGLQRMANSDSKAARAVPRMLQYIYKNAGQDPRIVKAAKRFYGEGNYIDSALLDLGNSAYELIPDTNSRARVHAVLDPDGAIGTPYAKLDMKKLTSKERKATAMLRDLGEAINDTSYRMGEISEAKWQENRGGKYIARMYQDIENSKDLVKEIGISESDAKQLFKGMYKTRVELNDALREQMIRDPVKLAVIRARQVRENAALVDYVKTAEDAGYVSDTKKDGWVKIPYDTAKNGKMFMSKYGGKYMRRDVYENINGYTSSSEAVRAMNNLLDIYDGNPARRLRKKMLTVYNPIVRTGNVTSNYMFAYLNGINPVTFTKNKVWAKEQLGNSWYPGQPKSEMKGKDPLFIAVQKSGLIGSDIVRSDRNLFDAAAEFGRDIDTKSGDASAWTKARRGADIVTQRYGQADDISKLSAVKTWVDRGYSVEEAIEKTSRGFQDYSRVGHMYDMGAKSPIFGNAFIRFQGDLWAGILRNAAIDHPLRLAALPIATYALGQTLSAAAGESEEDKKTREGRVGAPKIPFTDISTEFQTPWGAVDASRFMGVYTRQDLDGNSITDELSRMLPFNIFDPTKLSTKEGQTDAMQKAASDPLIGPLISMMFDVDWRGKSISDPDGVRNGEKLFPEDELSGSEKWVNRAQYTARQYMPYPYKEAEDIYSSITERMRNEQSERGGKNDPRKPGASIWEREGYNSDGSKKNTVQSIARLLGLRVEQFGKDEAKNYRDRQQMFDFFDKTDEWKKTLDTETRRKFESRHKSTATRSGVNKDFVDDPFYKYRNASDLKDDKLFEAEKNYAKMQNEYDGKPIDPLFNLRKDYRLRVLWKNSLPPGASDPDVTRMYDEDWYQNFRIEQDHYYAAKTEYNTKRGFNPNVDKNPYPQPSQKLQNLNDFYYSLSPGDRTRWRNAHPDLYQEMKNQWSLQDEWKNREREQIGLGPLDEKKTTTSTARTTGTRTARTRSSSRSTRSSRSRSSGGSRGGSKKANDGLDIDTAKVAMKQRVPKTASAPNVKAAQMKKATLKKYQVVNGKRVPIKVSGKKRVA